MYSATIDEMPVIKPITFQDALIADARSFTEIDYLYGGVTPEGFDCSGFVQYVFRRQGLELPRMVVDQANVGQVVYINEVKQGDLIFFKRGDKVSHVAIVTDTQGKLPSIIHSSSKYGVSELDLDESVYWRPKIAFLRRVR